MRPRPERCTRSTAASSSSPARARASGGAWRTTSARRAPGRRRGVERREDAADLRRAHRARRGSLGVEVDIQDHDQIDAMVAQTVETFGRVDGIINNAQTFRPNAPVAEVDAARRRRVLPLRRARDAVGDAGRVPAHEGRRVGSHRELRVVDGIASVAPASARTTRRRRRSAGSHAPRRRSGRPTASS